MTLKLQFYDLGVGLHILRDARKFNLVLKVNLQLCIFSLEQTK